MKAKGIIGIVLIALEILAIISNFAKYGAILPTHSAGASAVGFAIGYFLPLILGVLLLVSDLKGRNKR